jgi:HAD superfamily hydrolase (TIGR01484 family)
MNLKEKELVIFDLDGTLAESKQALDIEMAWLLTNLLKTKKVAVISGGSYIQFQKQFLSNFPPDKKLFESLFLFPASGTMFYRYENGAWKEVYSNPISEESKKKIIAAFAEVEKKLNMSEPVVYGEKIEDRRTQITYSALGQQAPLVAKKHWDEEQLKRKKIVAALTPLIPDFGIRIGGMTSIDVTEKGIDKAYGVRIIEKTLNIPMEKTVFVGDALFPGGNDYPAKTTGVDCVQIKGVPETKDFIRELLKSSA